MNHLWELPYGGWVAKNIFYLGYAGIVNFGGLRSLFNHSLRLGRSAGLSSLSPAANWSVDEGGAVLMETRVIDSSWPDGPGFAQAQKGKESKEDAQPLRQH